ncbi:hypothetical protein MKX03_025279 [Papaver bracteatum]|nr:hypothetical protein MKX03_025279 [Papaver bracteatum]
MVIPDPYTAVTDLMDHIYAARMGETTSNHPCLEGRGPPDVKKKKLAEQEYERERKIRAWRRNRCWNLEMKLRRYTSIVVLLLNCLLTATGAAQETDRIRKYLKGWQGDPPEHIRKQVLTKCRKWNLVWTAKKAVATLRPEEMEEILGYPKNHTSGIPYNARYKALGNSFQVHTVAYHLSVLKNRFAGGIKVLSLFTGIGGAEIALHELGIPLNIVVSVEKSEVSRKIFQNWWNNTNQQGVLIHNTNDVRKPDEEKLKELVQCCGGYDLVVGGCPCDNITGSNRVTRDGLDGEQSVLFYDFRRILNTVMRLMRERN